MKLKNTFLSILRHTLTTVGGVLIASPEPQSAAIGAILVSIGGLWGARDEHKAENPGAKSAIGGGVSMLVLGLAGFLAASTFTGCASLGAKATPAQLEARAYALINTAGVVVIADNPGAVAEIERIAAGVDAVFANGTLTPEQLSNFLTALKVPEEKRLLLAIGLNNAYQLYTAETGRPLVDVSDPSAAAILRGVRRGITDAIAFSQAFQAGAAQ